MEDEHMVRIPQGNVLTEEPISKRDWRTFVVTGFEIGLIKLLDS